MSRENQQTELQSRVIKTRLADWRKFAFIQQDDFKEWTAEAKNRLKTSILKNNFAQPFYVWRDPADDVTYCLDGRHRTLILEELTTEGRLIPAQLPATYIECKDKQEAAQLVLVFSSMYAKVTEKGLFNLMDMYDLSVLDMMDQVDLPGLDQKAIMGDFDTDFGMRNREVEIDEFTDEVVMKFHYPKAEYMEIKQRIGQLQEENNLESPEAVIKQVLSL